VHEKALLFLCAKKDIDKMIRSPLPHKRQGNE